LTIAIPLRTGQWAGYSGCAAAFSTAAFSLALADRIDEARTYITSIHKTLPRYGVDDFFAAFQFAPDSAVLFREGARRIGMVRCNGSRP
jgi:hypothetical protein